MSISNVKVVLLYMFLQSGSSYCKSGFSATNHSHYKFDVQLGSFMVYILNLTFNVSGLTTL